MGKKTRLWYVYQAFEPDDTSPVGRPRVIVAVTDRDPGYSHAVRIRTITPTAAGRKYIRHNLRRRLTEIYGPSDLDLVERDSKKKTVIRVFKAADVGRKSE